MKRTRDKTNEDLLKDIKKAQARDEAYANQIKGKEQDGKEEKSKEGTSKKS